MILKILPIFSQNSPFILSKRVGKFYSDFSALDFQLNAKKDYVFPQCLLAKIFVLFIFFKEERRKFFIKKDDNAVQKQKCIIFHMLLLKSSRNKKDLNDVTAKEFYNRGRGLSAAI
jgi:hypothetical protein